MKGLNVKFQTIHQDIPSRSQDEIIRHFWGRVQKELNTNINKSMNCIILLFGFLMVQLKLTATITTNSLHPQLFYLYRIFANIKGSREGIKTRKLANALYFKTNKGKHPTCQSRFGFIVFRMVCYPIGESGQIYLKDDKYRHDFAYFVRIKFFILCHCYSSVLQS